MTKPAVFLAAALTIGAFASTASAATCAYSGAVSPNEGCMVGSENNDKADLLDGFFGVDSYSQIAKAEFGGMDEGSGLSVSGSVTSGSFSIMSSLYDTYETLVLVLKGGNGKPISPNDFVAYELADGTLSGTYSSPFSNSNSGNATGISHITLYGGGTPAPVPLPAGIGLLAAALGGLGVAGLRRRKRAA